MLDAARRVQRLVSGMDYPAFIADERTYLAVERLLGNIGEAAKHVSPSLQARHSGIPWQAIVGMRNVLAHQYGAIDERLVWKAATKDLLELIAVLEQLVTENP